MLKMLPRSASQDERKDRGGEMRLDALCPGTVRRSPRIPSSRRVRDAFHEVSTKQAIASGLKPLVAAGMLRDPELVSNAFYSDRSAGPRPRDLDAVSESAWRGLAAVLEQYIDSDWLAKVFPDQCPDGNGVCGTDRRNLFDLLGALVPDLGEWPLNRHTVPPEDVVFDLVDFVAQRVAQPQQQSWH